jgi:hypothetical protein
MKKTRSDKAIVEYNKIAWNRLVEQGNPWKKPVSLEEIRHARMGVFKIVGTPEKAVLDSWFPQFNKC